MSLSYTYTGREWDKETGLLYPNGITTGYSYDSLNRLTSLKHASGSNTIVFANYSGFDKVGNRKNKTTGAGTEAYSYDPVYRLTGAATPKGVENYSYDAVGNRLTGPGPKDTKYQYNGSNQMINGRILSYLYDNYGNQISRNGTHASEKNWTESWDYENQLIKMEKGKGTEKRTITFKYDPFGRRIEKKVTTLLSGMSSTSTWTYVYDTEDIALEIYTDATGTVTKTFYTNGAGIDEHLALERNGNTYFYHADGLGSVTAISDINKNIVQSYEYDSFGTVKQSTAFANNYTYTGREWDKETGLYYYRARYYDPMEGRFISKDPISFAGGDVNLYGYVKNSPINLTDPSGLDPSSPVLQCHVAPHNDRCESAVGGSIIAGALICVMAPPISPLLTPAAPYIPAISNGVSDFANEHWGDGRLGRSDIPPFLFPTPAGPPAINPMNPSFSNYH